VTAALAWFGEQLRLEQFSVERQPRLARPWLGVPGGTRVGVEQALQAGERLRRPDRRDDIALRSTISAAGRG